jgi:hypothetical protein
MNISSIEPGAGLTLKIEGFAAQFGFEISVMAGDPGLKEGVIGFIQVVVRF